MTHRCAALAFAFLLACGGEPPAQEIAITEQSTGGAADEAPVATATPPGGTRSENLSALAGDPNISVYVEGPQQVGGTAAAGGASTFETTVRVVNDGGEELAIDELYIRFEVWSEDGTRTACTDVDDTAPPTLAEDGTAATHRGLASCTFPAAGEFEVRTYVSFEGAELDGDFDIERHYAGRTEVTVGG